MRGRGTLILFLGTVLVIGGAIWQSDFANFSVSHYLNFIQSVQKGLHLQLADLLRRVETDSFGASVALISFSFLYGVFHAAGPGHGKIIISTYLLTHKSHLARGILLSFSSSLIQGLIAIVVVTASVWFFDLSMRQTRGVINDVEIISFVLIMLVGFLIVAFRLFRLFSAAHPLHGHAHDGHDGSHSAKCGHAHGPSVSELQDPLTLGSFIGIIASIGIRPCSGAIIVLLLAYSLSLQTVGIFSVLAMSFGTALTISVLATVTVYFKAIAERLLATRPHHTDSLVAITDIAAILGGFIIFAFGATLFYAALFAPVHPFR
tara:strand:+ start:67 stop:1023 length:957 start_codon:yes stop_codon:yes gene_type:complete